MSRYRGERERPVERMRQGRLARSRAGYRRSRGIRGDRRGVVAVVGTLLALLVFFALFGVFLTQYLPLWMEDNEIQLSNEIQTSLSTLKSGVDDQYIFGTIPTYSVPFTLGSDSVPLLAQPTVASIADLQGCPAGFVTSTGVPNNIGACVFTRIALTAGTCASGCHNNLVNQTRATNYLEIEQPDRYYTPLTYFFEGDGVSAAQDTGHQWLLLPPPLNLTDQAGNLTVRSSQLVLIGNATVYNGQGSKDVTSRFAFSSNITSAGRFKTAAGAPRAFNLTLTFGVHNICGWYNFLNNTTTSALGASSSTTWTLTGTSSSGAVTLRPLASSVCIASMDLTYDLVLKILNVNYFTAFVGQVQLSFNAGGL